MDEKMGKIKFQVRKKGGVELWRGEGLEILKTGNGLKQLYVTEH